MSKLVKDLLSKKDYFLKFRNLLNTKLKIENFIRYFINCN